MTVRKPVAKKRLKARKEPPSTLDDEIAKKRKELRRLGKLAKDAEIDCRIAWAAEKRSRESVRELALLAEASPDSLGQIISAVFEICRKHYPKAYSAHLYIHNVNRNVVGNDVSCTIPIPLPLGEKDGGP